MSRGKAMPLKKFSPEHVIHLPVSIFYQTITGADVEMDIDNQWAEGDLVLRPDMSTAKAVPWAKEPTVQVIHDLYTRDGAPVDIAPRQVLKKVVQRYTDRGWVPVVAPELEFYLIKPNTDPNEPIDTVSSVTGADGFYCDEVAYATRPYAYGTSWDGCTVMISPKTKARPAVLKMS